MLQAFVVLGSLNNQISYWNLFSIKILIYTKILYKKEENNILRYRWMVVIKGIRFMWFNLKKS